MSVNVVFGAGGPTGQECIKRLLDVTNLRVRAVVRHPDKYTGVLPQHPNLEVVAGDVSDPASLPACLKNAKGVIFAASGKGYWSAHSVDCQGVGNVATAAQQTGAERVVLVSSMLVTPKNRWHPIRILLNNIRWSLMDNKFKGEDLLRKSGVPYTVVRPGGLTNNPGGNSRIIAGQGDTGKGVGSIARADVAAVCVEALTNPAAKNVTLEIGSQPGLDTPLKEYLAGLWAGLQPDK